MDELEKIQDVYSYALPTYLILTEKEGASHATLHRVAGGHPGKQVM